VALLGVGSGEEVRQEWGNSSRRIVRLGAQKYRGEVPRLLRQDLADGIFHVTTRGVNREPIFRDDADRVTFLRLLAETIRRHSWRCHAFCLMGTHYHLVVEAPRIHLSHGLHRLNGVYAQVFNRRHSRTGHLFGDRFHAWVVDDDQHFAATCRYVLENPVRAGLCARPSDWPWSKASAA
jgi:putative transposase